MWFLIVDYLISPAKVAQVFLQGIFLPQTRKRAPSPMCIDLPIILTTTVSHRGGFCLHFPRDRHKNVLSLAFQDVRFLIEGSLLRGPYSASPIPSSSRHGSSLSSCLPGPGIRADTLFQTLTQKSLPRKESVPICL